LLRFTTTQHHTTTQPHNHTTTQHHHNTTTTPPHNTTSPKFGASFFLQSAFMVLATEAPYDVPDVVVAKLVANLNPILITPLQSTPGTRNAAGPETILFCEPPRFSNGFCQSFILYIISQICYYLAISSPYSFLSSI
jgi:hypothetical protein